MNKKMRELLTKMEEKTNEAKSIMAAEGEQKEVAKANALMDEVDALKAEYEAEKRLFEAAKLFETPDVKEEKEAEKKLNSFEEFAKAVQMIATGGIKNLSEGVLENGGYIVPEDIQTKVEQYKQEQFDLKTLVDVENVTTNKGARTFQKKSKVAPLAKVDEGGAIPKHAQPTFERKTFEIEDYAGYIPITNDLIEDNNPTNITNVVAEWFAKASVATDNAEIIAAINTKESVDLKNLDGIRKAINVTLGQAYAKDAKIVTNDDGLNYLDTLKDANERPLLNPDVSAPARMVLRIGAHNVPVEVVPNSVMTTSENKIPFTIGDLKEAIKFYDRKKLSLKASDVATVGDVSAFENNLTFMRAIERIDVVVKDSDAFVNGYITVAE